MNITLVDDLSPGNPKWLSLLIFFSCWELIVVISFILSSAVSVSVSLSVILAICFLIPVVFYGILFYFVRKIDFDTSSRIITVSATGRKKIEISLKEIVKIRYTSGIGITEIGIQETIYCYDRMEIYGQGNRLLFKYSSNHIEFLYPDMLQEGEPIEIQFIGEYPNKRN